MTYYDILEISENASEEVIRMAYKALAKKYHPDVYKGDPKEAEDKMKKINEAFEVLSNEQKRKQYDDCLRNKRNATTGNKQRAEYNQSQKDYNSKMKICIISAVTLSLLAVVIVGTLLTNGIITKDDEPNNQNDNITNNSDYIEENKQSFSEWTEENKEKSDFLDECIVFVIDGFDDYYYTYDEMVYVTQKMDDYTFWAYDKEQAIALNYVASNVNVSNGWSSEKANFLDERIVFVIDGFGNYYYTYDEMIAVTQQMDEYEYWAYNTEQAIAKGYKHH